MKQSTQIIWWSLRMVLALLMLLGALTHITHSKEGAMADTFITALVNTGYLWPLIGGVELLAGVSLIVGRFIPLTLIMLAPITLNILLFHLSHPNHPDGIGIAFAIVFPHLGLAWLYRKHYATFFKLDTSLKDAPAQPLNSRA